jgi:hypothetical protein
MQPPTFPVTPLRLARLTAWARLMLAFVAQVADIPAFAPFDDYHLFRLRRMVAELVVIRAARRLLHLRRRKLPASTPPGHMRAVIGASLRRRLRARGVGARIACLREAFACIDALAARLARRLARGLTRRRPILPRASADASPHAAVLAPPFCADTL